MWSSSRMKVPSILASSAIRLYVRARSIFSCFTATMLLVFAARPTSSEIPVRSPSSFSTETR